MINTKEIKAMFNYKGDSKSYHRLYVKTDENELKGTLYIPKGREIPDKVILVRKQG